MEFEISRKRLATFLRTCARSLESVAAEIGINVRTMRNFLKRKNSRGLTVAKINVFLKKLEGIGKSES